MTAVVSEGPRQARVKDVPDARIERPTDQSRSLDPVLVSRVEARG